MFGLHTDKYVRCLCGATVEVRNDGGQFKIAPHGAQNGSYHRQCGWSKMLVVDLLKETEKVAREIRRTLGIGVRS